MAKTNWILFSGILSTLVTNTFTAAQAQEITLRELQEAIAQAEAAPASEVETIPEALEADEATGTAEDLRVHPRFRIDYSTGGGFDGLAGLEGFIPLRQTSGSNVTYFNGRLNLDNDANFASNVLVGHRVLSPGNDRIYGGYAAWDTRNTGEHTFHQLGAGIESLGETWDWRINGYVPVGNTRRGGSSTPQVTGSRFQDNDLLLDVLNVQNFQSALGGIEAEVGAKLADFGNQGDLRGFGGVYYRDGAGTDGTIGGSLRLEAQPVHFLNVGAGVQYDDIFGTNVLFQIGLSLPSPAVRTSHDATDEPVAQTVYSRAADTVGRTNAIIVDTQVSGDTSTEVVAIAADTGNALSIQHVDPTTGTAAGTGTVATPFDTIANAATTASSGDIIYVQAGNAGGGFTLPDGVDLLSTGPEQMVTTQYGDIALPGSGAGTLPTIDSGSIVLGNDTTISGFEITNAPGDAIAGNNIRNVTIQNNRIDGALGSSIKLEDVGGNIVIDNNQLNNSLFDTGIFVTTGASIDQQLTITNNNITGNAEQGILVRATDSAQVVADIQNNQIAGNNIADPAKTGLEVEASNADPGSLCLNLADNNSDTNHTLTLFPDGQFQVVDLDKLEMKNTGTISQVDNSGATEFSNVSSCTI